MKDDWSLRRGETLRKQRREKVEVTAMWDISHYAEYCQRCKNKMKMRISP